MTNVGEQVRRARFTRTNASKSLLTLSQIKADSAKKCHNGQSERALDLVRANTHTHAFSMAALMDSGTDKKRQKSG